MHVWYHLLSQALLTLNLLRRINPKLSAYAQLHGQYDYNANHVAPLGIQVLIHEKSNNRISWAPHGVEGWFSGPAMEYYSCSRVIASKTGGKIVTYTVQFPPHDVQMPGISELDRSREASIELIDALTHMKHVSPTREVADNGVQALKDLTAIFYRTIGDDSPKLVTQSALPTPAPQQQVKDLVTSPIPRFPIETGVPSPRVNELHIIPDDDGTVHNFAHTQLTAKDSPRIIPMEERVGKPSGIFTSIKTITTMSYMDTIEVIFDDSRI